MKIVQLHLYLFIWCEAAGILTDQLTDFGQNVTINCDFVKEVNWLLLKLPDPPVMILRTFSSAAPHYYNNTFRHKYSVKNEKHLLIKNATIDDLGLYYCVTTDTPLKYSDGTRLHIIEPTEEIQNHTVVTYIEKNQTHWQIIFISVSINSLLIIVIIGLLKVFVHGRSRDNEDIDLQNLQDMDFKHPQDSTQTQIYYMKL